MMGTSPRRGALAQRAKKKKATQQTVRYANETGMVKRKKPRYVPKRGKRQGSIENRVQEEEQGDTRFATEACIAKAVEHLIKSDPKLEPLLEQHGRDIPQALLPKTSSCPFHSLGKSICYQQLHIRAASTIFNRLVAQCGDAHGRLNATNIIQTDDETLRNVGLSRSKVQYLKSLSEHFESGAIDAATIGEMDASAMRQALLQVKGLGPWSVDMFSMFHLGHADCLPVSDLGVRKGMQKLYGLQKLPSKETMEDISAGWRPYRSVGSWLMWRVMT
ncbi:hypothetical protein M9435_000264 [Picochlorum sp. BPE23]|nr:hypothetical protein M9435_000264 [Picochlorum sp. BPE23]